MNKRVAVGMSGGVDSSVAAYILKNQGYEPLGCNLKMYVPKNAEGDSFDTKDAMEVCVTLGIPFGVHDCTKEFEERVIGYFTEAYLSGKTPNPCVFCNKNMKFPSMLAFADMNDCGYIATGHYARIKEDGGRFLLLRGVDLKKDQSYMLYRLTQNILSRTIFPLGDITKDKIRELAMRIGLSVAQKKDSQDICFIAKGEDYTALIREKAGVDIPVGDFVDTLGNRIGCHKGIISYTIGQRKGLGISSQEPYYVLDKRVEDNCVVLGRENELYTNRVFVKDLNYIPFDRLEGDMHITAKLRYSQQDSQCVIHPTEEGAVLEFSQPQRAVTRGQAAVFYDGDVVIGGGEIC